MKTIIETPTSWPAFLAMAAKMGVSPGALMDLLIRDFLKKMSRNVEIPAERR